MGEHDAARVPVDPDVVSTRASPGSTGRPPSRAERSPEASTTSPGRGRRSPPAAAAGASVGAGAAVTGVPDPPQGIDEGRSAGEVECDELGIRR